MTEPGGEKRSVLSSAHLWVSTRNDICPDEQRRGWFACQVQAELFVTGLNFVSAQKYFSWLWMISAVFLYPSHITFVGKSGQPLDIITSSSYVTHTILFFLFFTIQFSVANITMAVGTNDPWVQSPLCSLSNSHLMTSWLDVCIKQMWLAMRGLKQDRTAYSL